MIVAHLLEIARATANRFGVRLQWQGCILSCLFCPTGAKWGRAEFQSQFVTHNFIFGELAAPSLLFISPRGSAGGRVGGRSALAGVRLVLSC